MRNAPEVVREVGVHDFRMATEQQLLHLYSGLLSVAPSAVGVDFRWKVGFEDRRKRQFGQPPLHPMRFDVRKVLTVYSWCALIGTALGIGMRQNILAADFVVQGIEAIV